MPSGWEWLIVVGVIALLFGGAKLPKLARSLGSAKGEFEKGLKEGEKASKSVSAPVVDTPSSEVSHEAKMAEAEAAAAEAEAKAARAKAEAARLAAEANTSEA
jgi:sec-independent protein translocase protein TatA